MDLIRNLRAGIRLAFLRPVALADFRPSPDQVVGLAAVSALLAVVSDYVLAEPPVAWIAGATGTHALWLLLTLLLGYVAAREKPLVSFAAVATVLLSPVATGWVLWTIAMSCMRRFSSVEVPIAHPLQIAFLCLWLLPVAARALRVASGLALPHGYALTVVYLCLVSLGSSQGDAPRFFGTDTWTAGRSDVALEPSLNAEDLLHSQHERLADALSPIEPGRVGLTDLYFIGFGADASQDVFRREVEYVRGLFDERFDTRGRSVVLINHAETIDRVPVASASNLDAAVSHLAARMQAEDVLFVFLTGHGSEDHELAVNFPPLPLNPFGAKRLAASMDAAGIGWRVVVVSSCYSGGYIEHLANERTLILTASASSRPSFGCSSEADFTYFGRALFQQELSQGLDFVSAFRGATARIQQRERAEGLDPSSPQMSSSPEIEAKLDALVERLERSAHDEVADGGEDEPRRRRAVHARPQRLPGL